MAIRLSHHGVIQFHQGSGGEERRESSDYQVRGARGDLYWELEPAQGALGEV